MPNDKAPAQASQPQMVAILQPSPSYRPGPEINKKYPQSEWVYMEIPEIDFLGGRHSGVTLNGTYYGPGKHFVPPDIAEECRRIIRKKDEADVHLNQPTRDLKALAEFAKRNPGAQIQ